MDENKVPTQPAKETLTDEQKSVIQPIRTYERDVADALRNSNASVVSINLRQHQVEEPVDKKSFFDNFKPGPKIDRVDAMPKSPIQAQPNVAPAFIPLQKNAPVSEKMVRQEIAKAQNISAPKIEVPNVEVPPQQINVLRKPNEGKHFVYLEKEEIAKKSVFFLVSIVLLVAGVSAVAIIYFVKLKQEPLLIESTRETIIKTEYKEDRDISSISKVSIVEVVKEFFAKELPPSTITEISFNDQRTPNSGENISIDNFMKEMAPSAPGNLVRAFGDLWMFGIYSNQGRNETVILVDVDSFDNAFDGMLAWENSMPSDLQEIFPKRVVSTSTAPIPTLKSGFEDLVVKNKDARILKNSFGEIVLVYSFIDEKTLAITWSKEGLEEIIARFFVSRGAH